MSDPAITLETIQTQLDRLSELKTLLNVDEVDVIETNPLWAEDLASVDPQLSQLSVEVVQWLDRASARMLRANVLPQNGRSSSEIYEDISARMKALSLEASAATVIKEESKEVGFFDVPAWMRRDKKEEVSIEIKPLSLRISELNQDKSQWFAQAEARVRLLRSSLTIRERVDEASAFTIDALKLYEEKVEEERSKINEEIAQQEGSSSFTTTQRLNRRLRQLDRAFDASVSIRDRLFNELTVGTASIEILDSSLHSEQSLLSRVSLTFAEHELSLASLQVASQSKKAIEASQAAELSVRQSTDNSVLALAETLTNKVAAQFSSPQEVQVSPSNKKSNWFSKLSGLLSQSQPVHMVRLPNPSDQGALENTSKLLPFLQETQENFVKQELLNQLNWKSNILDNSFLTFTEAEVFAKGLLKIPLNQYVTVSGKDTNMLFFALLKIRKSKSFEKQWPRVAHVFQGLSGHLIAKADMSPEVILANEKDDEFHFPRELRETWFHRSLPHMPLDKVIELINCAPSDWKENINVDMLFNANLHIDLSEEDSKKMNKNIWDLLDKLIFKKEEENAYIIEIVKKISQESSIIFDNSLKNKALETLLLYEYVHPGKKMLPDWVDVFPIVIEESFLKKALFSKSETIHEWFNQGLELTNHPQQEQWSNIAYQLNYCHHHPEVKLPYDSFLALHQLYKSERDVIEQLLQNIDIEIPEGPVEFNPVNIYLSTDSEGRYCVFNSPVKIQTINRMKDWWNKPDEKGLLPAHVALRRLLYRSHNQEAIGTFYHEALKHAQSNGVEDIWNKSFTAAQLNSKNYLILNALIKVKHLPLDILHKELGMSIDEVLLHVFQQSVQHDQPLFGVIKTLEKNDLSFIDETLLKRIWYVSDPDLKVQKYVGSGLKALALSRGIDLDLPELTELNQNLLQESPEQPKKEVRRQRHHFRF